LRDAIFNFLASWTSQALANISDLSKDGEVQKIKARFLPKEVQFMEWIEARIGGEIELGKEGGPHPIIHLSKPAQAIVAEKFKKMQASRSSGSSRGGSGSGAGAPRPKAEGRPPADGKKFHDEKMSSEAGKKFHDEKMSSEAFFKQLPEDELTPEELELHDAILDWLGRWPAQRPDRPKNSVPLLGDLAQDPAIQKLRTACMPPKVSIRDWVDRRIGGEVEVRKDSRGQFEVLIRGSEPARDTRSEPARDTRDRSHHSGKDRDSGKGSRSGKGGGTADVVEAFFAGLPDDSLTDAEAEMRIQVLDWVESRDGASAPLLEASKDHHFLRAQQSLLPPEVPLRLWINRRIGGEVRVEKDNKGQIVMVKISSEDPTPKDSGSDKKEEFFASLPEDSFNPEEEDLRDTLLAFIGNWKGNDPPSLTAASGDAEIRRARSLVLPKNSQVSLKDWIERRIGGEIEMAMDPRGSGNWLFGLRGALELPQGRSGGMQAGGGSSKRRRMG
jgi:hypothetical protein